MSQNGQRHLKDLAEIFKVRLTILEHFALGLRTKLQCRIQSYFEAGILVWDPKLRPPNFQKCKN